MKPHLAFPRLLNANEAILRAARYFLVATRACTKLQRVIHVYEYHVMDTLIRGWACKLRQQTSHLEDSSTNRNKYPCVMCHMSRVMCHLSSVTIPRQYQFFRLCLVLGSCFRVRTFTSSFFCSFSESRTFLWVFSRSVY